MSVRTSTTTLKIYPCKTVKSFLADLVLENEALGVCCGLSGKIVLYEVPDNAELSQASKTPGSENSLC